MVDVDAAADEKEAATAFLAQKAKLKKEVEEESRKMKLKTFVGKMLAFTVNKLSIDQLAELRKLSDFDQLPRDDQELARQTASCAGGSVSGNEAWRSLGPKGAL